MLLNRRFAPRIRDIRGVLLWCVGVRLVRLKVWKNRNRLVKLLNRRFSVRIRKCRLMAILLVELSTPCCPFLAVLFDVVLPCATFTVLCLAPSRAMDESSVATLLLVFVGWLDLDSAESRGKGERIMSLTMVDVCSLAARGGGAERVGCYGVLCEFLRNSVRTA